MMEQEYVIYYRHCELEWVDIWTCACNSECPACGKEIEPYKWHAVNFDEHPEIIYSTGPTLHNMKG